MKIKVILALLVILLVAGCALTDKKTESTKNETKMNELAKKTSAVEDKTIKDSTETKMVAETKTTPETKTTDKPTENKETETKTEDKKEETTTKNNETTSTTKTPPANTSTDVPVTKPNTPQVHQVAVNDTGFEPADITIIVGETVKWTNIRTSNLKKAMILGTQDCIAIKSKILEFGESYSYTFNKTGPCTIVDGIFNTQISKVIVGEPE